MAVEKTSKRRSGSEEPGSAKKRKADLEELEVNLEAPEPPSKRARRAEKKGKTLPAKPSSDDEGEKKKGEAADAKESKRSAYSVWIGNLPWSITPDELRKWLVDNSGESITEENITRINMPTTKQPGKQVKVNKGFAYVDFAEQAPQAAAITLSENWLGIRKLLIKDAKSYEGRPKKDPAELEKAAAAAAAEDVPASRKIFVGNLSFQTTEDDVRANFDKCGEIDWVKVATFEDSGKCKGYGWVKFREAESAGHAVKGFVRIKEEIPTESDFIDKKPQKKKSDKKEKKKDKKASSDSDSDSDSDSGDSSDSSDSEDEEKEEEKKYKMRKWWVNRIAGRNLKIELAEDDQVRYQKRFKGKKNMDGAGGRDNNRQRGGDRPARDGEAKPAPPKELKGQDDLMVARLTGTVAKPTGTKITFD